MEIQEPVQVFLVTKPLLHLPADHHLVLLFILLFPEMVEILCLTKFPQAKLRSTD